MIHRETSDLLFAVLVDNQELAHQALAESTWLDPDITEELLAVFGQFSHLPRDERRHQRAVRIGDILRSAQREPGLHPDVIECYRAAFYFGKDWEKLADNPLYARFLANKAGLPFDKWIHYFDIYSRVLAPYVGQPVRVLEIGVFHGGGLDQLRALLGPEAVLIGADIDPAAQAACHGRFDVMVGDQTDPDFLASLVSEYGPFDVIIDDGGHTMTQQIISIENLFPSLRDGGVYLVEDTHTSYWPQFHDGDETFMEWAKRRVDDINAYHFSPEQDLDVWTTHVTGLHFYDSIVVFEKSRHHPPFCEITGTGSFLYGDRQTQLTALSYRAALELQHAQLHRELEHADTVATEAIAANQVAQEAYQEVIDSAVWRWTKPLRKWQERRQNHR